VFTLKDGDIESGLFRRDEGDLVIYADATGKERTLALESIEARHASEISLMPDNFADIITAEGFNNLLTYLLARNGGSNP